MENEKSFSRKQAYAAFIECLQTIANGKLDQDVLKQYPGTGGLKEFLLPLDSLEAWSDSDRQVYESVKRSHELLAEIFKADYKKVVDSIKASTLTSFYTPGEIVDVMSSTLASKVGNDGKILEPSAGSGAFIRSLSETLIDPSIIAIEKDVLAARILRSLYPTMSVINSGFEDYKEKPAFDLVISNIPFGQVSVYDGQIYKEANPIKVKSTTRIHNYFFVKGLDVLDEGGILAYITSNAVMDSPANAEIRKYLVSKANLVGAVRLPNSAFRSAGTSPVTDIIYLQKDSRKKGLAADEQLFVNSVNLPIDGVNVSLNQYYERHHERILGKLVLGGQYNGKDLDVEKNTNEDYLVLAKEKLNISLDGLKRSSRIISVESVVDSGNKKIPEKFPNRLNLKEGNLAVVGTEVGVVTWILQEAHLKVIPSIRDYERVGLICQLRDLVGALVNAELTGDQKAMEKERRAINEAYDVFNFRYGLLSSSTNRKIVESDIEGFKLASLERMVNGQYVKSDIFFKQVNNVESELSAKSIEDGMLLSLNTTNGIDISFMSELLNRPDQEIIREGLDKELFYFEPSANGKYSFVPPDLFQSGNIVKKLDALEGIDRTKFPFMSTDDWERHYQKLFEVRPPVLPRHMIEINMGVNWVPVAIYKDFAEYLFETECDVKYLSSINEYLIELKGSSRANEITYAAQVHNGSISGKYIFEYAMQDQTPKLTIKITEDLYVPDVTGMKNVENKVNEIKRKWDEFTTKNERIANELASIYNREINNLVPRKYSGDHLIFPELSKWTPKKEQRDLVWKLIQDDGGLGDHVVGAGKTLSIVLAAMRMRQLGIARKPLILCLKANIGAIIKDFKSAYPEAKILAPTENDFKPKKRKAIFSSIATNDWDAIIMTHENYQRIPQDPEVIKRIDQEEIDNLTNDLLAVKGSRELSKRLLKGLEKRKSNLEAKLKMREASTIRDEDVLNFQSMGFDHMFVDESHEFKNLPFTTRQGSVSGLGTPEGSNRARNLLYGIRTIQQKKSGDKGVSFLTGTPISNSLVELYLLKKYLRPSKLNDSTLNLSSFDSWAKMFARKSSTFEFTVTGEVKQKTRYREFINLPELSMWYKEMAHTVLGSQLKQDRPELEVQMVNIEPSRDQLDYIQRLIKFTQTKEGSHIGMMLSDTQKQAYMLLATNLARKMSMDMRMIDPSLEYDPNTKIGVLCSIVAQEYEASSSYKGTQMIFSDIGTPGEGFNVYAEIKRVLIEVHKIPADEIQFVHDHDSTKIKKAAFVDKLNEGTYRIALGSTKKIGTGVNAQERLIALHHIDVPWTPKDVEQRNGRGWRPGAKMAKLHRGNKMVSYVYAVNRTLDAYQYNILSNKQRFIEQLKTNSTSRRLDEGAMEQENGMNYNEFVALLSGNNDLLEKAQLEKKIAGLELDWKAYQSQQQNYLAQRDYEVKKMDTEERTLKLLKRDSEVLKQQDIEQVPVMIKGKMYGDKKAIGEELLITLSELKKSNRIGEDIEIARQGIFRLMAKVDSAFSESRLFKTSSVWVVSDNGSVYRYAQGVLNENPALAGRYIIDSVKRVDQVIATTEASLLSRRANIDSYTSEISKKFTGKEEMDKARVKLKELEDRLINIEAEKQQQKQQGKSLKQNVS